MRCLTVCQPWAHAIFYAGKRVENRSWPTSHRGALLIHAGASRRWLTATTLPDGTSIPSYDAIRFGAILGAVDVLDCVRLDELAAADPFATGPWCWLLANPRPLLLPIPYRGRQRLFDVPDHFLRDPAGYLLAAFN